MTPKALLPDEHALQCQLVAAIERGTVSCRNRASANRTLRLVKHQERYVGIWECV